MVAAVSRGAIGSSRRRAAPPPDYVTADYNDNIVGVSNFQHRYLPAIDWQYQAKPGQFENDQHYSMVANAYIEFPFTGVQIEWWSEVHPWHGITAISIDGGPEVEISQYAAQEAQRRLLWMSPMLVQGPHIIRLRVTGRKEAGNTSPYNYLVHDKFVVRGEDVPLPPSVYNYIVSPTGLDTNLGTFDSPMSLSRSCQLAGPGQTVAMLGGIYRETPVPANSGVSGNPVSFIAYPGHTPIVSGLNVIGDTGWTIHDAGLNIYKKNITLPVNGHQSTLTSNLSILANQLFKDGEMQFEASTRILNNVNDLFEKTRWKALSMTDFQPTFIIDPTWNGKNLAGATINIQGWFATDSRTISSQSGSQINFPSYSDNSSTGKQYRRWYYISNHLSLLTQAKGFHYSSGTLYYKPVTGQMPTGMEYKARNWGFDLRSKSYITIRGISFIGCEPVTGNDSTNYCTVDNIRATFTNHCVAQNVYRWQGVGMTRQMGLKLTGTGNQLINSEIAYGSTQGVWIGANGRVENNWIHHFGYDGGWGAGVDLWGEDQVNNIVVTKNTISHTSRSSISFGYAFTEFTNLRTLNLEVSYNDMSKFCLFSDDGGATYTWGFRDHTGSTVHHNWFRNAGFVLNPLNLPQAGRLDGIATGFYTDQGAGPFTVHHNLFFGNCEDFLGDAADIYTQPTFAGGGGGYRNNGGSKFYNNTLYSNSPWTGKSNPYNSPPEPFRNNIIRKTWTYFPSGSIELGGENSNIYNNSPAPLFNGGSLATPQDYFGLQAGSPAVNRGITIAGITDGSIGAPDAGCYERGVAPWVPGYIAVPYNP